MILNSLQLLLTGDYTVLTADRHYVEASEGALLLARMKGRKIMLPATTAQHSAQLHLLWHRENKFLG